MKKTNLNRPFRFPYGFWKALEQRYGVPQRTLYRWEAQGIPVSSEIDYKTRERLADVFHTVKALKI